MSKLGILVVGGIGYVLGTRAGRERYDQIRGLATKVKDNPRVQEGTHRATAAAKEAARDAAPVVKEKVSGAASSAAQSVKSAAGSSNEPDGGSDVPLEEGAYPVAGTEKGSSNGSGSH